MAAPGARQEQKKQRCGHEDSEDESEILEESPCGRWLKRREEVQQWDVPGIDAAYLAMDMEDGVEVVWNEVLFSERKYLKGQEDEIRQVFNHLIQLEHPNIVKFHQYWIDNRDDKPRVIFITEYMSSGSLKQFLKRTRRNVKKPPLQAWKRWCTQILSALSFLHSCQPAIVHGNLTCDTIFIQHNGLIKIGSGCHCTTCFSLAPDAIHQHVKSCREGMKNTHFLAPEFGARDTPMTPAVDIYSFGMCALEMAALEIHGTASADPSAASAAASISGGGVTGGASNHLVTDDQVEQTIQSLEVQIQSDFIRSCLKADPAERPTARGLLFHGALFEVSPLRLLAAHIVVRCSANIAETISDQVMRRHYGPGVTVAEVRYAADTEHCVRYSMSDVPQTEKLEKFVDDVKYGIYPLTVFAPDSADGATGARTASPETSCASIAADTPEPVDLETRRICNMMCDVKPISDQAAYHMTLLLRMDDRMNRQLSCTVFEGDGGGALADELVRYGFVNDSDRQQVALLVDNALASCIARNEPVTYRLNNATTVTTKAAAQLHSHHQAVSRTTAGVAANGVGGADSPSSLSPVTVSQ